MPVEYTSQSQDVCKAGIICLDGKKICDVGQVDFSDASAIDADSEEFTMDFINNLECTVECRFSWPEKYTKAQLRFFRRYLFIDLARFCFPKKKDRRGKRLKRRQNRMIGYDI